MSEHFISSTLEAVRCPACPGVILLQGYSGGFLVQLETLTLSSDFELQRLLAGGRTYSLEEDRGKLLAEYRTLNKIKREKRRPLVVAAHQCERKTL